MIYASSKLKVLLFIISLLHSSILWSVCSPHMGLATINEISKEHNFFDDADDFVEIKKVDNQLNNNVMDDWNLEVCETVFVIFTSCSGDIPLSSADVTSKFWTLSGSPVPASYIDWLGGLDIVLKDQNGYVVDYVSVNGVNEQYEACPYPYDTDATGDASTRRMRRLPDGVGDWDVPPGNSEPPSEGEDNTDVSPPVGAPSLSFLEDVTVGQGQTATVTFVLDSTYASDVEINYSTVNGIAVDGVDYTGESGSITIPSGQLSITLDIDTLVSGSLVDQYFFITIQSATNANVIDQIAQILITTAVNADHFQIIHSGSGVNCEASLITIRAVDGSGSKLDSYIGTIDLSTSTAHGDWTNFSGNGTFTPIGSNVGTAQYQFVAGDTGEVILSLLNTHAETISINVEDGSAITEQSNGATAADDPNLTFAQAGFKFIYGTGAAPTTEVIPVQTSGKAFGQGFAYEPLKIRAITTDIDTGVCTSLFTGNQNIELALECNDPSSCNNNASSQFLINGAGVNENGQGSVNSYSTISLSFSSNGTADLTNTLYNDAGRISLHARYQQSGDNIVGTSQPIEFTPAGFCTTTTAADYTCAGPNYWDCEKFKKAGEDFEITVTAQGWQADGDTDFCDNNSVLPNFSGTVNLTPNLISPTPGEVGVLSTNSVTLSSGEYSGNIHWSEVGVLNITAGGNGYLNHNLVSTPSHEFGRFYPYEFFVSNGQSGSFADANSGFSYLGELDSSADGGIKYGTSPSFDIVARNQQGGIIKNYFGSDFNKSPDLAISVSSSTVGADSTNNLTVTAGFNTPVYSYDAATGIYTATLNSTDHFVYDRDGNGLIAPFTNDISLSINNILDDDGVESANIINLNPTGGELRFGRLLINNAYGPETDPVIQVWQTEYFDGTKFILNTDDNNTVYDLLNVNSITVTDVGNSTDPLQATDSSITDGASDSGTFSAGRFNGTWRDPSTPTNGTVGLRYGTLNFIYTAPIWLTYDWSGTGFEDPSANVSFGQYRGIDKIIYWKEINY